MIQRGAFFFVLAVAGCLAAIWLLAALMEPAAGL